MSRKANIVQQNRRRKKRGLKPRRAGWVLSAVVAPQFDKCQSGAQPVPYVNNLLLDKEIKA
ncbi:MAG: hypothetical protein RMX35_29570 [Nostoc sp. DcaGUA01]|uniref:hypothetical protein n=1 Tax=Nostoc sp. CCY 9925 TaxID=3103865 RepID=UPI002AD858D1|nr:hypothetical protein [Nostoc sp. DcaGUA01]